MYYKSLVVFVLCTAFVVAFALVLNFEVGGVGNSQNTSTVSPLCTPTNSAQAFQITSARLHTVNYTDELGVVNYAVLTLGIDPTGTAPMMSIGVCVGSAPAGTIQGPFQPGVNRMVNFTLPETISVSPGKTYVLTLDGVYGSGTNAWETTRATAD